MKFLSFPGSCSFEVMPGTLRNVCMSASLSRFQEGYVSGSIGASTMPWCVLDSFIVLAVRALALEAIFGGLCQVCV